MTRSRRGRRPGPPPQAQQPPTGKPRDRQASAAQLEAEGAAWVPVQWRGLEFLIPPVDEWSPYTVVIPLSQGNVLAAVGALLGPDQLIKMQRRYPRAAIPDFFDLFSAISKATGYGEAGN